MKHTDPRRPAVAARRAAVPLALATVATLLALPAPAAPAARLDPAKPEDALKLVQKSICSLNEGETVVYWWQGSMYARVEGERDRELFKLQGVNVRQCRNLSDPKRGPGFRSVSREVMIHLDPQTGAIVDRWKNPWTGEDLEVFHVANDPVNMRQPMHAYGTDGKPIVADFKVMNGRAWRGGVAPLFYRNPLQGDWQDWVGGTYHASEMGNDFFYADDLYDARRPTVGHHSISWTRISGWLPWMKMGDRNGAVYTATVGARAKSLDELPEPLRSALRIRWPQFESPPPLDDARPNETSWEVFRKRMEARKTAGGTPEPAPAAVPPPPPVAPPKPARGRLDPADADDAFRMNAKVICSTKAGEWSVFYWDGTVYSRIRGEKDRHLFNVAAMSMRQCQPFADPVRGVGSRAVNREIVFYLDPKTNEILRSWTNPWSGETVEVMHVHNDPVNSREPSWSRDAQGKPTATFRHFVVDGQAYQGGGAALLFYDNPLAGDYQDYVGNKYQTTEFLTSTVPMRVLDDPKTTRSNDTVISWGRISRWLPWMKMGGREGLLVHYTGGLRLNSFEELPDWMKTEIRANYPVYVEPPPVDDRRPNETSWTVFKERVDAERAKAKGAAPK